MNLRSIDLNLLVIFDALMAERSITGAARKVGITPSAMSHALHRLRQTFKDELLERPGSGMVPTQRALDLLMRLRRGLDHFQELLARSLIGDRVIGTDQFDRFRALQPLARLHFARARLGAAGFEIAEEMRNRHVQDIGDLRQPRCTDPIGAALVFLDLLEGEPERSGERLLVHPDQQPSRADAGADMNIDRVGHARPAAVSRGDAKLG
jgi:hypothetical protein